MFIDAKKLINSIFDDLDRVRCTNPNERLPKEEQCRCSIFHWLQPVTDIVCAERGYRPVEDENYKECDIWAKKESTQIWLELKTCRSVQGFNNKPSEEFKKWTIDIKKLRLAPKNSFRYFLLMGYFDFDPLQNMLANIKKGSVLSKIKGFYPDFLKESDSRPFSWRKGCYNGWSPGVSHICAWIWLWDKGKAIESY